MSKGDNYRSRSRINPFSNQLPDTSLRYILEALIPYSQANIKLAFKPSQFFSDLEKIDRGKYSRSTLRRSYYRAINDNYVQKTDKGFRLTDKGKRALEPYQPEKLDGSHILVIFDIPESEVYKRQLLRLLLVELKFKMVQKSVWVSDYECRDILRSEINRLNIEDYVQVFEAVELKL
ncbi:hypothetical protein CR969_00890 [Candidatus Saccharibacteria bacterium]|nr:MAG: hypothetical protein CR969_00890 [Candidatus Saccharibacteria bacterium]